MGDLSPVENDEMSQYDIYGKTPPRTKILRKNRERKQKHNSKDGACSSPRGIKMKHIHRRNTVGSMYEESGSGDENDETDQVVKRSNKRQMKLLRGSERDLKLDIASAQAMNHERFSADYEYPKTPGYHIESNRRFMSLLCRTFPCKQQEKQQESVKKPHEKLSCCDNLTIPAGENLSEDCPESRVDFYNTFKVLIRMGSGEKTCDRGHKRLLSREETMWRNELKDLIWLELQAYHADRSPTEEDDYLCNERAKVEPLLNDMQNYKFQKHSRRYSTQNSDSGVEDDCSGCLSIFCHSCLDAQNDAIRDIEKLLLRLEEVESLFSSSKAFAELFPLYNCPDIAGRIKAMCLWLNMTKHQRLKLNILGKMLDNKDGGGGNEWGLTVEENGTSSPSDSNSSTNSSVSDCFNNRNIDLYNITPITSLLAKKDGSKISPYRRYIQNVLKTRALNKSLNFLKNLHQHLLKKTQLTLELCDNNEIFNKTCCDTEEEELRRYGVWSPEAQTLNLPSYRSMFIFLAMVPLEVVNEYLKMRLEQKPEKPSPLSVRQLMRELKEGLQVTVGERKRACEYIESATSGVKGSSEMFWERIHCVDNCIVCVFKDYLDYLEQWVLLNKNKFPKNFLEEEYQFCLEISQNVVDGKELMTTKFIFILGTILRRIGERLLLRIEEILDNINKCEEGNLKQNLFSVCRELQHLFNEEREMSIKALAFIKSHLKGTLVKDNMDREKFLIEAIVAYKCIIPTAIAKVQGLFDHISIVSMDELDKNALNSRIREILMQVYRFGFEFYREMSDTTAAEFRGRLVLSMVSFANLWMKFVTERCEKGRGMRPRWAYQGMEFLLTVCEPINTQYLSEEMFEGLKKDMDICISHVIGTAAAPSTPDSGFYSTSGRSSLEQIRARSRGSSPSPRPAYKSQRSSRKTSNEHSPIIVDSSDLVTYNKSIVKIKFTSAHSYRYREAVDALETEIDTKLRNQNLIGKVLQDRTSNKNVFIRRTVNFSWQRGIKIGQGRFGKVYTAVNNQTGDMMAVKEISLQHNDNAAIKRVAEEMKILEGIIHRNLVRYYGVEVHKDEMLIFMEYCSEGTLESLIAASESGLSELLVRRYSFQLVSGIACLHDHGIVHRDIKTANIFLTDEGNFLKIGDFGCAAKIKSNHTMPGELKGFVGTQAYMAPEVFTKNMSEGHGRAADIWSVGCVVVEMASGKRPWAQYDSNFQIMFKVGMGQSPDPPDDMIDEGLDFLDMCFKHDPKERATARELLAHNFVKVGEDLI